jgi:8-oxo-dGTP pyrophosphatase MutT (NUDIX family)
LPTIENQIKTYRPAVLRLGQNKHAAVALMLRQTQEHIEALFIERAQHENDPWSGQMALPGGMVEGFDADARRAAERETLEEVGIDLTASAYLGRLDDQQGRHRGHTAGIVIRCFVYAVDPAAQPSPNNEVQDIVWAPVHRLLDARNYTQVDHPVYPGEKFPGIRVSDKDHQIVWGLTRRFIASFFTTIQVVFEG